MSQIQPIEDYYMKNEVLRDNATKQTQVKATQNGTITIKISTTSLWRYSNKMDGELQHTTLKIQ